MDRYQLIPAAYVALRRDSSILLLLREGTGYLDGHWAMPAGHVEAGESARDAAAREAFEEVGVRIEPADLTPLCAMHRTRGSADPIDERVDFFFATARWSGEPRLVEADKAAAMDWFALDALPEPVVPHELLVLELLRSGAVPAVLEHGFGPGH